MNEPFQSLNTFDESPLIHELFMLIFESIV